MSTSRGKLDQEIVEALAVSQASTSPPKPGQALGRTTSGKIVEAPRRRGAPDTNDIVVFRRTKARFPGWTRGDHMEAAEILRQASEAAEANGDRSLASTLSRWSSVHWDIGGRWTSSELEAYLRQLGLLA